MAFLKGNSAFPATSFSADHLSESWTDTTLPPNNSIFTTSSSVRASLFRLRHLSALHINGVLVPSTTPYTGSEQDTSYLYDGDFHFDSIATQTSFQLPVPSAGGRWQSNVTVLDQATGVFFDPSRLQVLAWLSIEPEDTGRVTLHVPTSFVPHHNYYVHGTLIYESVEENTVDST